MDSIKNSPILKCAKTAAKKSWWLLPALIAGFWIVMGIDVIGESDRYFIMMLVSIVMLLLDCFAIYLLSEYKDKLLAILWKRLLLLACNILACTAFWFLFFFLGASEASFEVFIVLCPPFLFLLNIASHRKNAFDRKMFWGLLLSDPMLHYMATFFYFYVPWIS